LYIMPGQEGRLTGSVWYDGKEDGVVGPILAGNAKLEVITNPTYYSPGLLFGRNSYYYESIHEFMIGAKNGFYQMTGDGD